MNSERELYDDWKPLLEAQQDALVTVDLELELEKLKVEQTNYHAGTPAGFPAVTGTVWKKPPHPAIPEGDLLTDPNDDAGAC